jgi:hypothetical protein
VTRTASICGCRSPGPEDRTRSHKPHVA